MTHPLLPLKTVLLTVEMRIEQSWATTSPSFPITSFSLCSPTPLHSLFLPFLLLLGNRWLCQKLVREEKQGPSYSIVTYLICQELRGILCSLATPGLGSTQQVNTGHTSSALCLPHFNSWHLAAEHRKGHLISLSHGQTHKDPYRSYWVYSLHCTYLLQLTAWISLSDPHVQCESCWIYSLAEDY